MKNILKPNKAIKKILKILHILIIWLKDTRIRNECFSYYKSSNDKLIYQNVIDF